MKRIITLNEEMDAALVEYAKQKNMTIATAIRLALKQMLEPELGVTLNAQLEWGGKRDKADKE